MTRAALIRAGAEAAAREALSVAELGDPDAGVRHLRVGRLLVAVLDGDGVTEAAVAVAEAYLETNDRRRSTT